MSEHKTPAHEQTGNPSLLRRKIAPAAWDYLRQKLELSISEESRFHLRQTNDLLLTNPVVLYANHTSKLDAPLLISMILSELPNAKHMLGPAGMKHYDWRRDPVSAVMLRALKLINVHAIPVVQVGDTTDYGLRQRQMIDRLKQETAIMNEAGSLYGIAPEGTRGEGILQQANRGIGYLEQYGPQIVYTPAAIMYGRFSDYPEISIGEPLTLERIVRQGTNLGSDRKERAQAIADIHMMRLALLMPPPLRGPYT